MFGVYILRLQFQEDLITWRTCTHVLLAYMLTLSGGLSVYYGIKMLGFALSSSLYSPLYIEFGLYAAGASILSAMLKYVINNTPYFRTAIDEYIYNNSYNTDKEFMVEFLEILKIFRILGIPLLLIDFFVGIETTIGMVGASASLVLYLIKTVSIDLLGDNLRNLHPFCGFHKWLFEAVGITILLAIPLCPLTSFVGFEATFGMLGPSMSIVFGLYALFTSFFHIEHIEQDMYGRLESHRRLRLEARQIDRSVIFPPRPQTSESLHHIDIEQDISRRLASEIPQSSYRSGRFIPTPQALVRQTTSENNRTPEYYGHRLTQEQVFEIEAKINNLERLEHEQSEMFSALLCPINCNLIKIGIAITPTEICDRDSLISALRVKEENPFTREALHFRDIEGITIQPESDEYKQRHDNITALLEMDRNLGIIAA